MKIRIKYEDTHTIDLSQEEVADLTADCSSPEEALMVIKNYIAETVAQDPWPRMTINQDDLKALLLGKNDKSKTTPHG